MSLAATFFGDPMYEKKPDYACAECHKSFKNQRALDSHNKDKHPDGRPASPLACMHYLDGYLSAVYDSDMPDGAWWAAMESLIEEHWPGSDGFESVHAYIAWKNPAAKQ